MLEQYLAPEFYLQPLAGGLIGGWRRLRMSSEQKHLDKLVSRALGRVAHYNIDKAYERTDAYVWLLKVAGDKSITHDVNRTLNAVRDVVARNNYEHKVVVKIDPLRVEIQKAQPDAVPLLSYTKQLDKLVGEYLFVPGVRQKIANHVLHPMSLSNPTLPQFLLAATTGAGKTMMGTSTLVTMAYLNSPERLSMLVIDPKVVDIGNSAVSRLPHLACPVITEPDQAIVAIRMLEQEMERRKAESRRFITETKEWDITNRIFCYVDELAELLEYDPKAKEPLIAIAREGRGLGIHLMLATQRPSADSFDTTLRSLLPVRIGGSVRSSDEARIVMGVGDTGLEQLQGVGLFQVAVRGQVSSVQGWYIPKDDLKVFVDSTRRKWGDKTATWRLPVEKVPRETFEVRKEDTRLLDAVVEMIGRGNEPSLNKLAEMRQNIEGKGIGRKEGRELIEKAKEMVNVD